MLIDALLAADKVGNVEPCRRTNTGFRRVSGSPCFAAPFFSVLEKWRASPTTPLPDPHPWRLTSAFRGHDLLCHLNGLGRLPPTFCHGFGNA